MFGFSGGEDAAIVARKRRHMVEAQERWPFLTHFDASTIKNPQQLVTMVKERWSRSHADAERDVLGWAADRKF